MRAFLYGIIVIVALQAAHGAGEMNIQFLPLPIIESIVFNIVMLFRL